LPLQSCALDRQRPIHGRAVDFTLELKRHNHPADGKGRDSRSRSHATCAGRIVPRIAGPTGELRMRSGAISIGISTARTAKSTRAAVSSA